MALAGRPGGGLRARRRARGRPRARARVRRRGPRRGRRAHRSRRRRRDRVARGAAEGRRLLDPHRPSRRARARMGGAQRRDRPPGPPPRRARPRCPTRSRRSCTRRATARRPRPSAPCANIRSCAGTTSRSKPRRAPRCPATASRRSSATSTRPRRWTPVSTRSAPSPRSTACPSARACRSAGRSTPIGDAAMPAVLRPGRHADSHGRWPDTAARTTCHVGDRIVGTEVRGRYRRYVTTEVLAHWSTIKPAYRVTLEDGTELITSGDHRFLTNRGWKFVTGASTGPGAAPHLTTNNELLGTGRFAAGPEESSDYRRGYLCGMIRGDGHIGSSAYKRADGTARGRTHRFRLALADFEALRRARGYLLDGGVCDGALRFLAPVAAAQRPCGRSRHTAERRVAAISRDDPLAAVAQRRLAQGLPGGHLRRRGLAAGDRRLRISNNDRLILDWTTACLASLRVRSRRGTAQAERRHMHSGPRRPARTAALLPPHRPRDHPQAHGRRAWR